MCQCYSCSKAIPCSQEFCKKCQQILRKAAWVVVENASVPGLHPSTNIKNLKAALHSKEKNENT